MTHAPLPADYGPWLADLKQRIQGARARAVLAANAEQIRLYHDLGREILDRQARHGWGAKVIDRLAGDLRAAFPEMKGLSASNLKYMRHFAQECPALAIGQQAADQLPWFHIVTLITKVSDPALRAWYARAAVAQSWPRETLVLHIRNQLHARQGAAVTNFAQRLEPAQAGLATEVLKDPYHFDFLGLGDEAHERDIENALIRHITRFLLELGAGFAFVGRQFRLDVTRTLQAAVLAQGKAGSYLVQHSAGSGKTNSIAWTAHFLAELHGADHKKIFDSVLVISDRTVIDDQLQEALFNFQRQAGVVATITNADGAKSAALAEALSGAKKIVVCTIQTFPFALAAVRELAATEGKRFAVIADEAHSSQTGQAATMLKSVLSPEELAELEDGGEVSSEDILAAQMAARAGESGITFVAFTATPKAKTLELFGTRPDPSKPAGPGNLPAPFHVYSMRQAIEEGFILDVLQNYTTYKLAFKLAHEGKVHDEKTVERSAALKSIMGWVRLHPYNISQKVEIVVEHFRTNVAPLLNGQAKAMVVVGSRVEAVRWQLAIRKYITGHGYAIGTLVAFSGEVNDKESGPDGFTERSASLNPGLKGDIREAFAGDDYRILLVANKFQTGSSRRCSTTATPPSRSAASSSNVCCPCWSSAANATASTCPRWC